MDIPHRRRLQPTYLLVIILLITLWNCSEPADQVVLDGKWILLRSETNLYGVSSIDQTMIDDSLPIPQTLEYSIPDTIQFGYVDVEIEDLKVTVELIDDLYSTTYQLIFTQLQEVREIKFVVRDNLYHTINAPFNYDVSNATVRIDSAILTNEAKDTLIINGVLSLPHISLRAGEMTLLERPEADEFEGVMIDTMKLHADQSCEITFHTPIPSLAKIGTWSSTASQLKFSLLDGEYRYPYTIDDENMTLSAAVDSVSQRITRLKEIQFGLEAGSLHRLHHKHESVFERIWWDHL